MANYEKEEEVKKKKKHVEFYINNLEGCNNWDLVDLSCYKILGDAIHKKIVSKKILENFARDKNMWKRRISMVSTLRLIKYDDFDMTLKLAKVLLKDKEDLI